jgi:hypothetical protein
MRNDAALKNAWADIVSHALTMSTTIAQGANSTRIFSAVNSGWTGSDQAFDKDILAGNLTESVMPSIRAACHKIATKIYYMVR